MNRLIPARLVSSSLLARISPISRARVDSARPIVPIRSYTTDVTIPTHTSMCAMTKQVCPHPTGRRSSLTGPYRREELIDVCYDSFICRLHDRGDDARHQDEFQVDLVKVARFLVRDEHTERG